MGTFYLALEVLGMPGQLRRDAWCPVCGYHICQLFRTEHTRFMRTVVELEFVHNNGDHHYMRGPLDVMNRVYDNLHITTHRPIVITAQTLDTLKKAGRVYCEEYGVSLVAEDGLFAIKSTRSFIGQPK